MERKSWFMVSWWNYMYAKLAHNMVSPLLFSHILTHWQANPGNFVTLKPGYTCTCMLQLQQVSCRVLSDILSDCCSDCHMFDFSCIFSIIIACIFIKKFPGDLGHSWNLQTFFFLLSSRFVTQLLSDLVYFVTEHDTGREDVLNISIQNPNRDRQKLMREQYILKEVSNN